MASGDIHSSLDNNTPNHIHTCQQARCGYIDFDYCLFVCLFVCTVTDFSGEDKASGVKFCMMVHGRPGQGISHFGELRSPRSPKSDESASLYTKDVVGI